MCADLPCTVPRNTSCLFEGSLVKQIGALTVLLLFVDFESVPWCLSQVLQLSVSQVSPSDPRQIPQPTCFWVRRWTWLTLHRIQKGIVVSSLTRLLVIVCLLLLEHSTHASPPHNFCTQWRNARLTLHVRKYFPLFRSQCAVQSDIFCTFTNISSLYPHDLATPIALGPLGHFRIDHTTVSKWTHRSKLARKQIWLESCLQSVTTVSGCKTLWQVPIIGAKPLFSILRKSGGERLILHGVTMRSRQVTSDKWQFPLWQADVFYSQKEWRGETHPS